MCYVLLFKIRQPSIILLGHDIIAIILIVRFFLALGILPFHKTGSHHLCTLRRRHLARLCLGTALTGLLSLLWFLFFLLRVLTAARLQHATIVGIILQASLLGRAVGNLLSNFSWFVEDEVLSQLTFVLFLNNIDEFELLSDFSLFPVPNALRLFCYGGTGQRDWNYFRCRRVARALFNHKPLISDVYRHRFP